MIKAPMPLFEKRINWNSNRLSISFNHIGTISQRSNFIQKLRPSFQSPGRGPRFNLFVSRFPTNLSLWVAEVKYAWDTNLSFPIFRQDVFRKSGRNGSVLGIYLHRFSSTLIIPKRLTPRYMLGARLFGRHLQLSALQACSSSSEINVRGDFSWQCTRCKVCQQNSGVHLLGQRSLHGCTSHESSGVQWCLRWCWRWIACVSV